VVLIDRCANRSVRLGDQRPWTSATETSGGSADQAMGPVSRSTTLSCATAWRRTPCQRVRGRGGLVRARGRRRHPAALEHHVRGRRRHRGKGGGARAAPSSRSPSTPRTSGCVRMTVIRDPQGRCSRRASTCRRVRGGRCSGRRRSSRSTWHAFGETRSCCPRPMR
jgi:hypothetical protein